MAQTIGGWKCPAANLVRRPLGYDAQAHNYYFFFFAFFFVAFAFFAMVELLCKWIRNSVETDSQKNIPCACSKVLQAAAAFTRDWD
jgi:hypothetical protein